MTKINRRKFLKTTGGMAAVLASVKMPAIAQGTTEVHILRWNDFVPACDAILKTKLFPEAEKALGIKVKFETVNANDLQARITSGIQAGAGPDVIMLNNNHPQLYKASLVDVSDIAAEVSKDQGNWYKAALANCSSEGKFFGVPMDYVGGLNAWRVSMFKDIGLTEFPKTWDAYRDAGKKLKAKGFPIGQSLGQSFGDPVGFAYPFLWSMGGAEVDDKGKVAINSKETIEAVKYMTAFWKDSMDEGGLAWDDSSNNRAFLASTICSTLNGASIYIEASRKPDQYKTADGKPLKDDILHAALPAGPKGSFGLHLVQSHVIPTYSKNQKAAKDLLRFMHTKANYEQWFETGQGFYTPASAGWESHKMWAANPVMAPFALIGKTGLAAGYPGESNAKAAEVLSKYLIGNMFAAAVKGQSAEDAVKACEGQLKSIYGA
ncbi:extracellular solute-binding protein [Bradyrhizobium sp.]|uniref:ABC transporter substrate-binding protein n=1 Tax=Bradyrhizobium sp. TaxID=376 RepID=UPI0025BB0517|nr:extracellular solute-binding protein [Bradyrhizobium sp.]